MIMWLAPAKRLASLALIVTLAGCSMMMGTDATEGLAEDDLEPVAVAPKAVCLSFPPIEWSRLDTPPTIRDVKAHNAAWRAWPCP